jgi:hypothetical protein
MKSRPAILPDPAGLYGLISFLLLCRFAGTKALQDGDTLWHIKVGQLILETGQLVTTDTFSHTALGKPWVAHEWLAEVFMAAAYNLGGLPVVAISHFLLAALTFNLLYLSARRLAGDWAALVAVSLSATPIAFTHLLIRPHLFTWLFGAITLHCLICNDKRLWLLPFLTAIWGNLHGGVLLGLVLQGAFIAGKVFEDWPGLTMKEWTDCLKKHRRSISVLGLSTLAVGLNPFGFALFMFNFEVNAEIFSSAIGEWKSADYQALWYVRIWFIWMFIMAARYGRQTDWTWRLLVPALMFQAMTHVRHFSIAALFIVPWLAQALSSAGEKMTLALPGRNSTEKEQIKLSCWSGPALTFVACLVLLSVYIVSPTQWQSFTEKHFALPGDYSQGAVDYINSHGAPGKRLFNEYSWGDYLIFALDPPPPIFIDGRADMYGTEIFTDYLSVAKLREDMDTVLEKYGIDWVLFPKDHPLVRFLGKKPQWQTVFSDENTVILVLDDEEAS